MSLNQKIIAVTGANGNLGRAVATAALAQGASVALLDIAFADDLKQSSDERIRCFEVNMFDEQATRDCFTAIGAIDGLCNAAGGFAMGTAIHDTTEADWQQMFNLNVLTVLNSSRACVPAMLTRGHGAIVNIGAAAAIKGEALMGPYLASKSTVLRVTETMAEELKTQGINVNCVMPSVIDTPQNRSAMPDADGRDWVSPEQLAEVICFLLSDAANGVHGACVPVKNLA